LPLVICIDSIRIPTIWIVGVCVIAIVSLASVSHVVQLVSFSN
jgi:hypothetical protein